MGSLIQFYGHIYLNIDLPLPQDDILPVPPHFSTKLTFKLSSRRILRHPSHLYFAEITLRVRF